MKDYCQNKTSPYDIRPEEVWLIEAAIGLGEWLVARNETTKSQQAAIEEMLSFLHNLPAATPGFHGEFGFRLELGDPELGHSGSWMVSVCRGMFEIYGCGYEERSEFEWVLCPGSTNQNNLYAAEDWIAHVSKPDFLSAPACNLVIEASTWSVVQ